MKRTFFSLPLFILLYIRPCFSDVDHSELNKHSYGGPLLYKNKTTQKLKILPGFVNHVSSKRAEDCREFVRYSQDEMDTTGLLVMQKKDSKSLEAQVLLEMYAHESSPDKKQKVWSVSKTFSGLMLGRLVQEKRIQLETSLADLNFDLGTNSEDQFSRKVWTVRNFWNMGSGLDWCEYKSCQAVDSLRLMYGEGKKDAAAFVLSRPVKYQPGKRYIYSAGNYVILQKIMRKVIGDEKEYFDYPYKSLLKPLGLKKSEFGFEKDGKGIYLGGSGLLLNLNAFSRLGLLILNRGEWSVEGKRTKLLTSEFYDEMIRLSLPIKNSPQEIQDWEGPAGGSIWINDESTGIPSFIPSAPKDLIYAAGHKGQFLLIFPSVNLVVARMGNDHNHVVHWEPFTRRALACFAPEQIQERKKEEVVEKKPPESDDGLSFKDLVTDKIILNSVAQELCSCHLAGGYSFEECKRVNPLELPLAAGLSVNLRKLMSMDPSKEKVDVKFHVAFEMNGKKRVITKMGPLGRKKYQSLMGTSAVLSEDGSHCQMVH